MQMQECSNNCNASHRALARTEDMLKRLKTKVAPSCLRPEYLEVFLAKVRARAIHGRPTTQHKSHEQE